MFDFKLEYKAVGCTISVDKKNLTFEQIAQEFDKLPDPSEDASDVISLEMKATRSVPNLDPY
jgi:hypothetical protein